MHFLGQTITWFYIFYIDIAKIIHYIKADTVHVDCYTQVKF